jgi:hypothetical protein
MESFTCKRSGPVACSDTQTLRGGGGEAGRHYEGNSRPLHSGRRGWVASDASLNSYHSFSTGKVRKGFDRLQSSG